MLRLRSRPIVFFIIGIVGAFLWVILAPTLIKVEIKDSTVKWQEEIPYKVQEVKTDSYEGKELFEGEEIVVKKGEVGFKKYKDFYREVWVNGSLYKKEKLKTELVEKKAPRTEIVYIGTKKPSPSGYIWKIRDAYYEWSGEMKGPCSANFRIENISVRSSEEGNTILEVFWIIYVFDTGEGGSLPVNLELKNKKTGETYEDLESLYGTDYIDPQNFERMVSRFEVPEKIENLQDWSLQLPGLYHKGQVVEEELYKFWKGPLPFSAGQ